jgi:nitrogen fixation NifU-like protein
MTNTPFNFWQDHSTHFLEMALRTDRHEIIAHPDGRGRRSGTCGDTVEMYLCVREDRIQSVTFQVDGCLNTSACANTVAYLAEGKKVTEGWDITPEDVIAYLETLPSNHTHCAELAVGAFYQALADYNSNQRHPWKKLYKPR